MMEWVIQSCAAFLVCVVFGQILFQKLFVDNNKNREWNCQQLCWLSLSLENRLCIPVGQGCTATVHFMHNHKGRSNRIIYNNFKTWHYMYFYTIQIICMSWFNKQLHINYTIKRNPLTLWLIVLAYCNECCMDRKDHFISTIQSIQCFLPPYI